MYFLYKVEPPFKLQNSIEINNEYRVRVVRPKLNSFHSIFWAILSLGKIREYQFIDQNNAVISSAQVMTKIFYLTFMERDSIHIGPCFTNEEHRGKGLYPFLLMYIMNKNLNKKIYIFTEIDNIPSQKGIEKAGFMKFANGYKSKFHFYKISKNIK